MVDVNTGASSVNANKRSEQVVQVPSLLVHRFVVQPQIRQVQVLINRANSLPGIKEFASNANETDEHLMEISGNYTDGQTNTSTDQSIQQENAFNSEQFL